MSRTNRSEYVGWEERTKTVGTKTTVYSVLKTHDQRREKHREGAQERKFK